MKKFKKIIAMGCAAVMAISAMSISAFAENSFQTIQTNIIEDDSASIPFVLSGTSDNNITANATIQMPVTQFDSVTMDIQSITGGNVVFEGELSAEITDIPGILLGNGYYLEIVAISEGQKNVYKTDFVMYQKCIGKSDIISDELRVFTGDILTATASTTTPDVDIQLALDSKYNEYLGSVQNNDVELLANGTISDGVTKTGCLTSSSQTDQYSYTVNRPYLNFYLGMTNIKSENTYRLCVLDSNENLIQLNGSTKGKIPFEVHGGDADDAKGFYFPKGTKLYVCIEGVSGSYDRLGKYEVRVKGYLSL